jgi:transcriptional regulator with XRE-family HTH domain
MVQLAQPEIIQIFRKRTGMNQGKLGAQAFDTSFESGRTKIKNIELGRQVPTVKDLEKIAAVLGVGVTDLIPGKKTVPQSVEAPRAGITLQPAALDRFPGLDAYIDMLNNAVRVGDNELINYICFKISDLLAPAHARNTATS